MEDELELFDLSNRNFFRSKSFLVPAGMKVTIDTHGANMAVCFLDDLGEDIAKLIPQMDKTLILSNGERIYSGVRHEADIANHASALLSTRPGLDAAIEQYESWISGHSTRTLHLKDERVAHALSLIKGNYAQNISVNDVASQVGLSVPRLTQLFKQVTGVPIRRFRLWHRIFATAAKLTEGYTLTEAALASGFSDYAQCSRVYRELCGASPSAARRNTELHIAA
jgi:AraC-like DNA-binding protein